MSYAEDHILCRRFLRDRKSHHATCPPDFTVSIHSDPLSVEEQSALIEEADFLILAGQPVSERALKSARRLKLIQLISAGYDRINLDLCQSLGIPVANNGGTNAIDVAEHTITLILSFYRRLFEMEVPEVFNGTVEIKSIAREAGYRSKIAVAALQEGIDPVGCCVGPFRISK